MANQFIVIPVPVGNGSGAAVDVSTFGSPKTIEVKADTSERFPIVMIEISNDTLGVRWSTIAKFTSPGVQLVSVAARWMRCTVKKALSGVIAVSMGGEVQTVGFAQLIAPAANGTGAGVNVSALPGFKTIQVSGDFPGACNIEVSNDNQISYQTVASFRVGESPTWSGVVFGQFMRVMRSGLRESGSPLPVVNIAAAPPDGASASATSAVVQWLASETWTQAYAKLAAITGPKICLVEFDPTNAPRAMTAGAYNLNEVLFMGIGGDIIDESTRDTTRTTIAVADGTTLIPATDSNGQRLSLTSQSITWDFTALTAPMYTCPDPFVDRALLQFEGGRVTGGVAPGCVANGTIYLTLIGAANDAGSIGIDAPAGPHRSTIRLQNASESAAAILDDGVNPVTVISDATCGITLASFGVPPTLVVKNFAQGAGTTLYAITVDGGGNVIATPV